MAGNGALLAAPLVQAHPEPPVLRIYVLQAMPIAAPLREPEGVYSPREPASPPQRKFTLEPWRDVAFVAFAE